jgi:hypothetical protein
MPKFSKTLFFSILLSGFIACSENNTDKILTDSKSSPPQQSETIYNALEDEYYTKPNSIDFDYLLIKNIPDVFDKFGEKFIHDWLLAYDCEYATLVKDNHKIFNSHGYDLIADVVAGKYDYPNSFIDWGPGTIILSEQGDTVGKLSNYIRLYRNMYSGSRIKDSDCPDTKNLYTRHEFIFKRIKKLDIEVPDEILNAIKDDSKSVQIKIIIKFTINKTTMKNFRSNRSYLIKQWADIDELLLYSYSSNFSKEPFLILNQSDLYE